MITLENESLKVEIHELGAEVRRVCKAGTDRMWSGDAAFWGGVSPILFPICSGLPNGAYTHEGKPYSMGQHGFARKKVFAVEFAEKERATFLLKADEETLSCYPWLFELRVTYTLEESALRVDYEVTNQSAETMYYSIGSHEAYDCPEGIEAYDVEFEKEERLENHLLEGGVFSGEKERILSEGKRLHLEERYFRTNALIFKNIESRRATLVHQLRGAVAQVEFPQCPYLLIWHPADAPFICIEPWEGICSTKGDGTEISEKEGILPLAPKEKRLHTHFITYK